MSATFDRLVAEIQPQLKSAEAKKIWLPIMIVLDNLLDRVEALESHGSYQEDGK